MQKLVGRIYKQPVDGVYTLGANNLSNTIVYHPIYNYDNPEIAPLPRNFHLKDNVQPTCIATTTVNNPKYTELFVTGDNHLYHFGVKDQKDGKIATPLVSNEVFRDAKTLYADCDDTRVIVWGLNDRGEVFYTSCLIEQLNTPDAWSTALPIVTNANQIAPYLNKVDKVNTFFVHTSTKDEVLKMEQASDSSIWQASQILLPSIGQTKAQKINSCTTQINILDKENKAPFSKKALDNGEY